MKTDSGLMPIATEMRIFKCMGAMLANPHDPYIQRGYRPFEIDTSAYQGYTLLSTRIPYHSTLVLLLVESWHQHIYKPSLSPTGNQGPFDS